MEPERVILRRSSAHDVRARVRFFLTLLRMEEILAGSRAEAATQDPCPFFSEDSVPATSSGDSRSGDEDDSPMDMRGGGPPAACSFLRPGQGFDGRQVVRQRGGHRTGRPDVWQVAVYIQELDLKRGYVCGSMWAENDPLTKQPVVTFWDGEIIDNCNFSFITPNWGASRDEDMAHWSLLSGFRDLRRALARAGPRAAGLAEWPYIFMRWKERFFVSSGEDTGLTIAGFYYVQLCRQTGAVEGYYFDPRSQPFQRLELSALRTCAKSSLVQGGHSFSQYQFR